MFSRLARLIKSWFGFFISFAEDPEVMLQESIEEMRNTLPKLNQILVTTRATVIRLEQEKEELERKEKQLVASIQAALKEGSPEARRIAEDDAATLQQVRQELPADPRAAHVGQPRLRERPAHRRRHQGEAQDEDRAVPQGHRRVEEGRGPEERRQRAGRARHLRHRLHRREVPRRDQAEGRRVARPRSRSRPAASTWTASRWSARRGRSRPRAILNEFEVEMGLKKPDAVKEAAPFPDAATAARRHRRRSPRRRRRLASDLGSRSSSHPVLKRAVANQYQVILAAAATALSGATLSPLPFLLLLGGEFMAMPFMFERLKRRLEIEKKYAARAGRDPVPGRALRPALPAGKCAASTRLRQLCRQIQGNYKGLSPASQGIMAEYRRQVRRHPGHVPAAAVAGPEVRADDPAFDSAEVGARSTKLEGARRSKALAAAREGGLEQNLAIKEKLLAAVDRNVANRHALVGGARLARVALPAPAAEVARRHRRRRPSRPRWTTSSPRPSRTRQRPGDGAAPGRHARAGRRPRRLGAAREATRWLPARRRRRRSRAGVRQRAGTTEADERVPRRGAFLASLPGLGRGARARGRRPSRRTPS